MSHISHIDWQTGYDDYDPRDEYEPEPEEAASVDAGACPVCGAMEEENDLGYCPPIKLKRCDCEHYCCVRCVKHCADPECANTLCSDCCSLCEGCAEVHCPEHTVAKSYCKHCCPDRIRNEHERPDYVYED